MIQLRSDCLVFEVSGGDKIPCSVEKLTIEVLADSAPHLDPHIIHNAAAAVLHYFREDLGRETVTIDEFTSALEHVLAGLGLSVHSSTASAEPETAHVAAAAAAAAPAVVSPASAPSTASAESLRIAEADLSILATLAGQDLALDFFPRLRAELKTLLSGTPQVVRFIGLRTCAKRLAGVQRWCPRSLETSDEIVRFLRDCWGAECPKSPCSLLVD